MFLSAEFMFLTGLLKIMKIHLFLEESLLLMQLVITASYSYTAEKCGYYEI